MLHAENLTAAARAFAGLRHHNLDGTVLGTIINRKVEDVAALRAAPAPDLSAAPAPRSLKAALSGPGRHFILECKRSSPSLGDFCQNFDLQRLVRCYDRYASAISVLCEEHFFRGSLKYLREVRRLSRLCVLCKDFIIDECQLRHARAAGADAVLLMLSVLTPERFMQLYTEAYRLGLEVLSEVSDEQEAVFASEKGLAITGLNSRNLKTLKIDLQKPAKLLRHLKAGSTVVCESGITSHEALLGMKPLKNFLIGSAISGAPDPDFAARSILFGLNKVCGLTREKDALDACSCNASIGGFIFAPRSPRYVRPDKAAAIIRTVGGRMKFAGVFVNAPVAVMTDMALRLRLDYLQLHGSESVEVIRALRKVLPDIGIIKAVKPGTPDEEIAQIQDHCDLLLLDSPSPGSGVSFDWSTVSDCVKRGRTLLSGGIGIDNAAEALAQGFAGLDLNSKLESAPGRKDEGLMRAAFSIINSF